MQKRKILIVDDSEDLLKSLRIILRGHDYATAVAVDGVSAISQAIHERPDLILLDLGLPAGDGFKVMERLSNIEALASIPVVVLSARDGETSKREAIDAGAKAFLVKPAETAEIISTIETYCNQPSLLER